MTKPAMLRVKNWDAYQHYKDRNPPWIKLATDTFQNYGFSCLQDASKLLAVCSWTLASRTKEGTIPADIKWIKDQCCLGNMVTEKNLKELIENGYLVVASGVLADCYQTARPETETETETETEEEELGLEVEGVQGEIVSDVPAAKAKPSTRGTRLDLTDLPDDWRAFAASEGHPDPEREWQRFTDYWRAKPGKDGVKLDWQATWRNWIRRAIENGTSKSGNRGQRQSGHEVLFQAALTPSPAKPVEQPLPGWPEA